MNLVPIHHCCLPVFTDINIMSISDNQGAFRNIQQNMNRRQFSPDNMFVSESSQVATRETLVTQVVANMCNGKLPQRQRLLCYAAAEGRNDRF